MWRSYVITRDGKIVPCCFDKDAKYAAGNMKKQCCIEIWRDHTLGDFRRNILQD